MHSSADAQWMQGFNTIDVNLQFPTVKRVGIGVNPTTFNGWGTDMLYLLGNSHIVGTANQDGPYNLNPVGAVASLMNFYSNNGTNFSSFSNGASTVNINYTWPSVVPTAGQVLSSTAGGVLSWVTAGTGNVTGTGNVNFVPLWSGSPTNLANSVIQQFPGAPISTRVNTPFPGFAIGPATDMLEVAGSTRVGSVAIGPALGAGTVTGAPLNFSGAPGIFPPAADGNNTDALTLFRANNAYDNSELHMSLGDNPEGIPDAIGANLPDKFVIGASPTFGPLAGTFQGMFSFSTASGLAIGNGVANLNGLDVGASLPMVGSTVPPNANVAIGTYAGVNAAPANGLIVSGKTGHGTPTPGNTVEINNALAAPNNLSGLRLTQFAGMTPVAAAPIQPFYLSINATGDVIAANAPGGGGGGVGTGTLNYEARYNTTTSVLSGKIYDDNTGSVGIGAGFSATPINTLSLAAGAGTSPSAMKIGIERTTVATAHGTPVSLIGGAAVSGGTDRNGGDLTLSGGISTGAGVSNVVFQVASGTTGTTDRTPTTKMYLAGSGKLGLGGTFSTPPTTDLAFDGSIARTIGVESNSGTGKSLTLQGGSTTSSTAHNGGDVNITGGVAKSTGTSNVNISGYVGTTLTPMITAQPFGTGGPFVGINNTAPGFTLDVVGDYNGTGNITIGGSGTSTAGWFVSDVHLKKNITDLTNGLQRVMMLHPVEYDFRQDEFPKMSFPPERQIGFIAQEMERVVPEVVHQNLTGAVAGFKGIAYQNLTALLTEAVKEQQNEILADDSALASARTTINDLTTRLSKLEAIVSSLGSNFGKSISGQQVVTGIQFYQNNPNPFRDVTTISLMVPESVVKAELVVINAGSNAEALRIPISMRGTGSVEVSASSLNSGQYLYSIIADGQQAPAKKMTVLK